MRVNFLCIFSHFCFSMYAYLYICLSVFAPSYLFSHARKTVKQLSQIAWRDPLGFGLWSSHSHHTSVSSVPPSGQTSPPPVSTATATNHWPSPFKVQKANRENQGFGYLASNSKCRIPHFSLSSLRFSMLSGFFLSARIFLFFSRSVCFFAPRFASCCAAEFIESQEAERNTSKCLSWGPTRCWTPPYCWVLLVRAFFFLASSSCFFRASSCSFLSFSSCDRLNTHTHTKSPFHV